MRDLSERDGEKIQDPESGGRKYRIECATHPEKSVESMAVAIPSNMASRYYDTFSLWLLLTHHMLLYKVLPFPAIQRGLFSFFSDASFVR